VGDWQHIAVVGRPIAFGIGVVALVLLAYTGAAAASIVTVVHEGGHMIASLMAGRPVLRFEITEAGEEANGLTVQGAAPGLSVGTIFFRFAGYPAPSLAGLGGAYVIADGNSWGVLVIGVVLLLAVLLIPAINSIAVQVTVVLLAGVLWALIAGGSRVQAAVAVGLVWILLIGGLRDVLVHNVNAVDARDLSNETWVPRLVWFAGWLVIAVVSLWVGGRVLLGYA
jgi:hypothetical protein